MKARCAILIVSLLTLSCTSRAIEVELIAGFASESFHGLLEVREGSCAENGTLIARSKFPDMAMMEHPRAPIELELDRTYCFTVYAIEERAFGPTQPCTVISAASTDVEVGMATHVVLQLNELTETEREALNAEVGARLCPPALRSPFDGEHLGAPGEEACHGTGPCAAHPRLRFDPVPDAEVYCVQLGVDDDFVGMPWLEVADDPSGTVELRWPDPVPVEAEGVSWRVRACLAPLEGGSAACPDDAEDRFGSRASLCTDWSPPRQFVNRPWGNLNGDARTDFALGGTKERAEVFLSVETASAETFDICGAPYAVRTITRPTDVVDCMDLVALMVPYFGGGVAIGNFTGDARDELAVTAPNCDRTEGDRGAGGWVYLFDGELRPSADHEYADTFGVDAIVWGVGPRPAYRHAPRGSALAANGLSVLVSGIAATHGSLLMLSQAGGRLAESTGVMGGFVNGRGDFSGDGREDFIWNNTLSVMQHDAMAFDSVAVDALSRNLIVTGDDNGNGRAEVLSFLPPDPMTCRQDIRRLELSATGTALEPVGTDLTRVMHDNATITCSGGNHPRCEPTGGCVEGASCPICFVTALKETQFAGVLPHGARYTAGRPAIAMRTIFGISFTDADGAPIATIPPAAFSRCGGETMRAGDFDADGYDDLLFIDRGDVSTLRVICGSDETPMLRTVENASGPFHPFGGTRCGELLTALAP